MGRSAAIASLAFLPILGPQTTRADPGEEDTLEARDADYKAGKQAVEARNWPEAARRFGAVALRAPENADVHNMLGFANRNLGKYDLAFKHYEHALAIDPRHKGAHEYIGETYLKVGDLASAQRHLAALERLCPLSCEELKDLQREIAEFRKKK